VRLENETVNAIHLPEISLMILPVMLIRDFGIQTKERREKRVLRVGRSNVDRWLRYDGCHIAKGDGGGGAIIKENSVRRGRCKRVVRRTTIQEGNVHDSASQQHVGGRVNAFNTSTRGVQFLDGRIVIAIKRTEETTIVLEVPIDGSREAVGVDSIAIGFVVLFVAWIIDEEGIRSRGTPNDNAIHGVSLMFGPFDVAVLLMMEIAKRKERNPRPLVMANAMDE
jgi:hypothetical protein